MQGIYTCIPETNYVPREYSVAAIIIIIIIITIIIIISFMQGIYTYIPETHYVPREYSVAANLLLLFMVLISLVSVLNLLYFYISTFRSMCAVPNMAVFCSSLTSCFPGMLLTYFFLNDFQIVPVEPIITGLFLHSTCAVFLLSGLYILETSRLSLLLLLILLLLLLTTDLRDVCHAPSTAPSVMLVEMPSYRFRNLA